MSTSHVTRREWLATTAGTLALLVGRRASAESLLRAASPTITIYKSPSCGCCAKWVDHLKAAGFTTVVHDTEAMDAVKDQRGVPKNLRSCHTALLSDYVVEGHVPAGDLLRLLREKPTAVRGLAAPGMPSGSPGMKMGDGPAEQFDVIAWKRDGSTRVYAKH
jgi:hypothetical protein